MGPNFRHPDDDDEAAPGAIEELSRRLSHQGISLRHRGILLRV
jgi:hypothetical protein